MNVFYIKILWGEYEKIKVNIKKDYRKIWTRKHKSMFVYW